MHDGLAVGEIAKVGRSVCPESRPRPGRLCFPLPGARHAPRNQPVIVALWRTEEPSRHFVMPDPTDAKITRSHSCTEGLA
jgi:hypothetical protein